MAMGGRHHSHCATQSTLFDGALLHSSASPPFDMALTSLAFKRKTRSTASSLQRSQATIQGASQINTLMKLQSNPSLIRRHNLFRHEIGFTKARVAGADQQLAASSRNRLDQRETEVINRSVQTKNRSISGAVSKAVAIPITRRSAPDFDAMKK